MSDFLMSFWAKPVTTMAIGAVAAAIAYAIFGTMTAAAVGFGTPSGLWLGFEIIRYGGVYVINGLVELLCAILEGLGDIG